MKSLLNYIQQQNSSYRASFWIMSLAAVMLHFAYLGDKAYHHDESLYATTSLNYARSGNYQFNPMLHGPTLFSLQALSFKVLPVNDFTGRLISVIAGLSCFFLGAFFFIKRAQNIHALVWMALFLLSPTLIYFNRFIGMDALINALFCGAAYCFYFFQRTQRMAYLMGFALLLGLMICTKLNFLFFLAIGLSFYAIWLWDTRNKPPATWVIRLKKHWLNKLSLRVLMVITLIFVALYSGFGSHWPGILDGLYRKMIPYWVNQHRIQRVGGPFDYYLPFFLIYEWLPTVFLAGIAAYSHFKHKRLTFLSLCLGKFALAYGVVTYLIWPYAGSYLGHFHLKQSFHLFFAGVAVYFWIQGLRALIGQKQYLHAFALHWFFFSLLIYSYAGEKVPWLFYHMVVPLIFNASLWGTPFLVAWYRRGKAGKYGLYVFLILAVSWQGFNVLRANFWLHDAPENRLVYTHTTPELSRLAQQAVSFQKQHPSFRVTVAFECQAVWPLSWYFRDVPNWYRYKESLKDLPDLIVEDWWKKEALSAHVDLSQYTIHRVPLRAWWVPDPNQAHFKNLLRYWIYRVPFNDLGHSDVAVLIKKSWIPHWRQFRR